MKCIALQPEDLIVLLEQNHLPKRSYFRLLEGESYGFYSHTKIYGIFRVKRITKQFYYLRKNGFRPLKLFSASKDANQALLENPDLLFKTWANRNRFRNRILLMQYATPKFYTLTLHHETLSEFNKTFKVARSAKLTKLLQDIDTVFGTRTQGMLTHLTSLGKELLFLTGWDELFTLLTNRTVYYETKPSGSPLLPIGTMYQNDFLVKQTIFQHCYNPQNKSAKIKNRLSKFTLLTSNEDEFMQTEQKKILQVFDKKKYFSYNTFSLAAPPHPASSTLSDNLENTDAIHIIAHGKGKGDDFYFQLQGKFVIGLSSLVTVKVTPTLVIISACESEDGRLLDFFFNRGTQTIITGKGLLFSKNLAECWGGFYQRLLVDKLTVRDSYALMIRRLSQLNDVNALKLTLHGYGKEKLHSFK